MYVATLPSARRRGFGAAITLAALLDGRNLGYRIGVLQSSDQGFPVYRRMGFVEVCRMEHFFGRVGVRGLTAPPQRLDKPCRPMLSYRHKGEEGDRLQRPCVVQRAGHLL